jgi:hypothetical protein
LDVWVVHVDELPDLQCSRAQYSSPFILGHVPGCYPGLVAGLSRLVDDFGRVLLHRLTPLFTLLRFLAKYKTYCSPGDESLL